MAGIRWQPEESDPAHTRPPTNPAAASVAGGDLVSDDDRSVAADSWSIKSDYGSTLDDDQRHVDASDVLNAGANFHVASDYSQWSALEKIKIFCLRDDGGRARRMMSGPPRSGRYLEVEDFGEYGLEAPGTEEEPTCKDPLMLLSELV